MQRTLPSLRKSTQPALPDQWYCKQGCPPSCCITDGLRKQTALVSPSSHSFNNLQGLRGPELGHSTTATQTAHVSGHGGLKFGGIAYFQT